MGLDRTQIQIRTILLVVGIQTAAVASTCRAGIQGIIATLLPVVLTCADRSTLDFSHYLVAIVVAMCFSAAWCHWGSELNQKHQHVPWLSWDSSLGFCCLSRLSRLL